jgi:HSP20 family molecular chaperone IbpA
VAKAAGETYPPYNVEETSDDHVRITLAVAGFSDRDLEVCVEGRQLIVTGRRDVKDGEGERAYLHRGIAARGFTRAFVLADGLEVEAARLEHGLLHIDVVRPEPSTRSRKIPIQTGASS